MAEEQMTYMAKFGADTSEFTGGIQQMASGFMATFGPAGIVVGAAAVAGAAIASITKEQMELARSTNDLAEATGIGTDAIQRFHYAAVLSGDSISTVDAMLNKLTLSMGQAKDATSAQAEAFVALGVSVDGKTTEEVFRAVAVALTSMQDKAMAASIAQDILGKSYKDSLPYMSDYLKNVKDIENHKVMTKEQLDQLEAGAVAYAKLGDKAAYAAGQVALVVVGVLDPQTSSGVPGGTEMRGKLGGGKLTPEALLSYDAAQKTADNVKKGIIDPFAGWTAAEVEVQLQTDKVTKAQNDLTTAMQQANTPANVEKVRAYSAALVEQKNILSDMLGIQEKINNTNPYYDPGAIENQGITSGGDIQAMRDLSGINWGPGANTWDPENYAAYKAILAFANQDTTGNKYLSQIKTLETQRYNPMNGNEYNPSYSYGSGKETFVGTAQRLMSEYTASQTVNVTISPDFSASAQSIADATAEAISRELARKAAL